MPSIFAVWEQQGWEQPLLEEQYGPNRTLLTLSLASQPKKKAAIKSGDKKVAIKTQQQQDAILHHMLEGKEYALADFIPLLGVQQSRVRILIRELIDLGKLEARGANRNRRYVKKSQ